jgi:hypothetical protein
VTDMRQPEAHDFAVPPLRNAGQGIRGTGRNGQCSMVNCHLSFKVRASRASI